MKEENIDRKQNFVLTHKECNTTYATTLEDMERGVRCPRCSPESLKKAESTFQLYPAFIREEYMGALKKFCEEFDVPPGNVVESLIAIVLKMEKRKCEDCGEYHMGINSIASSIVNAINPNTMDDEGGDLTMCSEINLN
jgi:DNA-directed RNA polymerase subunit RPC12/RpoP